MFDLAQHIGGLEEKTDGEFAGSCPKCGGEDRFLVWPSDDDTGGFWCRQCGFSGDGIDYLREVEGRSFQEACEVAGCEEKAQSVRTGEQNPHSSSPHPADGTESVRGETNTPHTSGNGAPQTPEIEPSRGSVPPEYEWQERAARFALACEKLMREEGPPGKSALSYLQERGFTKETVHEARLGVNPETQFDPAENWGMEEDRNFWIPRGVVIPWEHAGKMWGVNIRRPTGDVKPDADEGWKRRKYQRVTGSRNALYNADELDGRPVALVEGELDALAIQQESEEVAAVATGSVSWGRKARWRALLRCAPIVLVCFDSEEAGEEASRYWTEALPNAVRWRPHLHDAAEMLEVGANIERWVDEGLDEAAQSL